MKNRYLNIIGFLATLILITIMLPRDNALYFDVARGDQWQEEDMVALFDFPILKSEEEYQSDFKQAQSRYVPIYKRQDGISSKLLKNIDSEIDQLQSQPNNSPKVALYKKIYQTVSSMYEKGIINDQTSGNNLYNGIELIRVIEGDQLQSTPIGSIYTLKQLQDTISSLAIGVEDESLTIFDQYIAANILFDKELNSFERDELASKISKSKGFIPEGSLVVREGQIVDDKTFELINSYKEEYKLRSASSESTSTFYGNLLYVLLVLSLSLYFLFSQRREFAQKSRNIMFLFFIYIFMAFFCFVVSKVEMLNLYMVPMAIVPFYIVTFYNIRMSIFEYVSVLILCSMFAPSPISFFFINLTAGLAGVLILKNSYYRRKFFIAIGATLVYYIISFIAISLIVEPNPSMVKWSDLWWFPLNILILIALYQLVYVFEKMFDFVTDITLFELCDTNHFLLKELAEKAPGTFQHSVQVANLAEAAAKAIGANPLYARTGALYHDIGKMENPLYFVENCREGFSLHEKLAPEQSAVIIKQHISDGLKLAKKHKLPTVVVYFIASHHARSLIYYFYHQYKTNNPNGDVDISEFTYDGPRPRGKEETICMMADSVEAASRTLKDYSEESISNLVEKLILNQLNDGNFSKSSLNLKDIEIVKAVFKDKIAGMYHSRISYPDRKLKYAPTKY